MSPCLVVLLSFSPFSSVRIWFIYLGALLLGARIFLTVISS